MTSSELDQHVASMLAAGELQRLEYFLAALKTRTKKLVILKCLIDIFKEEVRNNEPFTVFDYSLDLDELVKHYMVTKLLLRRFDFNLPKEYQEEFYYYCANAHVSRCFIEYLIEHNMLYPEEVRAKVMAFFEGGEGTGE